jgi:hypothetical protein
MYDYVTIAFYKGETNDTNLLNILTKHLTGEFVHCEIVFSDSISGNNLSSGIWQNENVFFKKKTFGRRNWLFKKIRLSKEQVNVMKTYCKNLSENNIGFNLSGFLRAMTAYPRFTDEKCFFCSELIVVCFQKINMMSDLVASTTTPTILFNYVKNMSFSDVSPVFEDRLKKKPLMFMKF